MTDFKRLSIVTILSKDQASSTKHLMDREGLCTCGKFLKRTDAKLCLANISTDYCSNPALRNTILIAAYCVTCATLIDNTLRSLKGIHANPEPDRIRHEGK